MIFAIYLLCVRDTVGTVHREVFGRTCINDTVRPGVRQAPSWHFFPFLSLGTKQKACLFKHGLRTGLNKRSFNITDEAIVAMDSEEFEHCDQVKRGGGGVGL